MNKHVEKAKELRNATPMVHNCAQTIMEVYANDLGINKELANHLGKGRSKETPLRCHDSRSNRINRSNGGRK